MYYCIAIVGFIFLNTFRQYLGIEFFDFIPFGGPLFYLRCILFSMILIGLFKNLEVLFGLPNFNKNIMEERGRQKIIQHQAAYFFRYHFMEGFVDYRNRHRFNEVLNKIHQGEYKKKTLEGIASESGFASRITFFNVFKKHTGMSASDYIEKMKQH